MRLLAFLAALALPLTLASPAAADRTSWKWGTVYSADAKASAWGKVTVGQSGFVVSGNVRDVPGKACSWVIVRAQSAKNGRWKTHGFYYCKPGVGTFRRSYGYVLQIKIQVCRGTAKQPTGSCSKAKSIFTQGG
ncbi:hypothetical protein AB0K05_29905 [Nonomuraea sp. NPDC049486]|uniref:hypothetical protein n=1 Tax=Nonomuraea sp. NPDC049486 TaxID=3155773 RepID=UPI003443DA36